VSYAKLKGKITEVFGTQGAFAEAMGMDRATLSAKLNNKTPWKDEEIEKACELLHIPIEQVHEYFFCR
jgi:transcriptional regulator with XRE-family HTH domain